MRADIPVAAPTPRAGVLLPETDRRPPTLFTQVMEKEADFGALAPEWDCLHQHAAVAGIFNTWSWQFSWWGIYGAGRALRIVVVRRGESVVGILPLYLCIDEALGLPVRTLRVIGCGGDVQPDDLGALLAPGLELASARALADALLQLDDWDALELSDLDEQSALGPALLESADRAGLQCNRSGTQRIVCTRLPHGKFAAQRRRLAATHRIRLDTLEDPARVGEALETLAALHRKRFAGRSASFVSPEYMAMQLAAMTEWMARGWLRLHCLEIDGNPSAMAYCCRFRERMFMVQAGFDPAYAKWSPGSVVLGYALERAGAEGCEAFDYLRGVHGYKERLATDVRHTVSYVAYRPTLGAVAARAKLAVRRGLRGRRQ